LVDTNVKNDLTGDAIREIIIEIKRMQDELMSEDELQSVKNYIIGTYPMQLETPNSIASKILALDLYDIDEKFYNTYISEINKVTPQIVRQMAQKYLKPDNLVISVCGNTQDIIKSVERSLPDIEIIKQEKK
jgi:predicted Zn-dependent peptidase